LIFEKVGLPLIHHSLDGFNTTLFAYSQTGSGKTYTLSGGDTYDDRGNDVTTSFLR
jgi:kinesin family protein 6/9